MTRRLEIISLLLLLASSRAGAHSVGDTLTAGTTQATPGNPRSSYLSNRAFGEWDPRDWLTLRLDFTYTWDAPAAAPSSAHFPTSARNIFLFDMGADFMPNDHFTLSIDGFGSPRSTGVEDQQVPITTTLGGRTTTSTVDSQVRLSSWSAGGILAASYDTAGEGHFDTVVDATAAFNWYQSEQGTLDVVDRQGAAVSEQQLRDQCTTKPRSAACQLSKSLSPVTTSTGQVKLGASVTETFYDNTDVGVGGAYFLYTADPTQVVTKGTTIVHGSLDNGLALAPYWYTVRADVAERFKGFSLSGYFQYGKYVNDASYDYNMTAGIKLAYKRKWDKVSLKVTLGATGQLDEDTTGTPFYSGSISLGAKVRF